VGANASINSRKKPSQDAMHYLAINELDLSHSLLRLVGAILGTSSLRSCRPRHYRSTRLKILGEFG